jgi:PAS domain S-box-containing protein
MRIKTRLIVSFAISLCLMVSLAFILMFYSYEGTRELEKEKKANKLVSQTTDLIIIGEEYLVYQYPRTIRQWNLRYKSVKELLSKMEDSEIIRDMRINVDILHESFLRLDIIYFDSGKSGKKNVPERLILIKEKLSGQMRILSHDMIAKALKLSEDATDRTNTIQKNSYTATIAFLFLMISITAIASFRTIKRVTLPLTTLARDANIIQNGNLKHKISGINDPLISPKDEISELSLSFNSMTTKLLDSIKKLQMEVSERITAEDKLQKAHDGLDQEVKKQTIKLLKSNEQLKQKIKERKHIATKLQKNEEKWKSLTVSSPDHIMLLNLDYTIQFINHTVSDLTMEQVLGKSVLEFVPFDYHRIAIECFEQVMKSGETNYYETKYVSGDGELHYFFVRVSALMDENGKMNGFISASSNTTEQKQMEERLRQSRKMESIGTLTGGIAHDFNNLLYMISGNTELALEDTPVANPAHQNLQEIKSASLKAADIVKQLLHFSRKTDQKLQPIDAVTVIKDSIKFLSSTIPSTIKLKTQLPDTEIPILADSTQINQIMINLCINASQAMEETGGTLEIKVETSSLDKEAVNSYSDLAVADNYLKITLSDTGPAIPSEIINRIFDPYFTTKEFGKGSGMGLTAVQGIVKNHNGAITVNNQVGKGTAFTILFPVIDEAPAVTTNKKGAISHGTGTILFVDDEKAITNMMQQALEKIGYRVQTKLNPKEALDLFKLKPDSFDLVITDMTMPEMTGVKFAEKLREIRPDIPIILCTGHSSLIDEDKANQLGISGYVMKPVSMSKIAKAIREALGK